VKVTVMTKPV